MTAEQKCPDKGFCHHGCDAACFRVRFCEPLSNVYPRDQWPKAVREEHRVIPYTIDLTDQQVQFLVSQMGMRGWNDAADQLQEQHDFSLERRAKIK